jgi:hypothetical protein
LVSLAIEAKIHYSTNVPYKKYSSGCEFMAVPIIIVIIIMLTKRRWQSGSGGDGEGIIHPRSEHWQSFTIK